MPGPSAVVLDSTVSDTGRRHRHRHRHRSRLEHHMIEIIKRAVTNQHDSVDYLCVSDSIVDLNGTRVYDLNIQVIYERRKKRHISLSRSLRRYVDRCSETLNHGTLLFLSLSLFLVGHCNYFVTKNDCAWNEYVKKGKSSLSRSHSVAFFTFS